MVNQDRKALPLFPMSVVSELTDLSARQVRYYEEKGLVMPVRSKGNRRLFSFYDVDRLLEIKELIDQGVNLAGIKQVLKVKTEHQEQIPHKEEVPEAKEELSEKELHKMLRREIMESGYMNKSSIVKGELSRFYH
ncbi:MerR family transcriptional regulator [Alkalibacillus haloalkaliphilus]|uniref:HTH-type transcriptional regulator GlnR n=1 Tax=Alkalibacillus haloalkaliphilus TaxID=94136 RepID=A0A511W6M4_9BACI|nr:MerR family transcriptional regulator [Alkalibacillus haloalkaliphilus]MDV2580683.1 MerR family transcriptional regulator [Alkalibacillus haloalkaliphilus]GEN45002.1 HTH-type transcriptional regulator GlnR [Alkalibacillus haloalkaliphilus]